VMRSNTRTNYPNHPPKSSSLPAVGRTLLCRLVEPPACILPLCTDLCRHTSRTPRLSCPPIDVYSHPFLSGLDGGTPRLPLWNQLGIPPPPTRRLCCNFIRGANRQRNSILSTVTDKLSDAHRDSLVLPMSLDSSNDMVNVVC